VWITNACVTHSQRIAEFENGGEIMNEIKTFAYDNCQIRTIDVDGEIWFVGKDVCEYFGDKNYRRSLQKLEDDEKGVTHIDTPGGRQSATTVNESGMYGLLFNFQPQKANNSNDYVVQERIKRVRKFKKWVTSEVLPTIRRTGGYVQQGRAIDFVQAWMPTIDASSQNAIASLIDSNRTLLNEVSRMSPKEVFYDNVTQSDTMLDFTQVAKLLRYKGYGRNKLMGYLRTKKILRFNNNPYQEYVDRGYFKIVESEYVVNGEIRIGLKTVVSQKGVDYIRKLLEKVFCDE